MYTQRIYPGKKEAKWQQHSNSQTNWGWVKEFLRFVLLFLLLLLLLFWFHFFFRLLRSSFAKALPWRIRETCWREIDFVLCIQKFSLEILWWNTFDLTSERAQAMVGAQGRLRRRKFLRMPFEMLIQRTLTSHPSRETKKPYVHK